MTEQEIIGSETPSELEKTKQDILDRLKDAVFGSGSFQAFSDYFALEGLRDNLQRHQTNLLSAGGDPEKKLIRESKVRIYETRIALHEQDMERKRSTLPGYAKTDTDLWIFLDDTLPILAREEAEEKYPSDE